MGGNNKASSSFFFLFLFASLPCWKPAAAASPPGRWTAACNETEGGGRRCRVEEEEDAEEFQFDSEINRRLLAGNNPQPAVTAVQDANNPACKYTNGKPYPCVGGPGRSGAPDRTCGHDYYRCPP